jgi:hypothetical protein
MLLSIQLAIITSAKGVFIRHWVGAVESGSVTEISIPLLSIHIAPCSQIPPLQVEDVKRKITINPHHPVSMIFVKLWSSNGKLV